LTVAAPPTEGRMAQQRPRIGGFGSFCCQ